jgi:nucleoside-triphosphatase THEP1
MALGSAHEGYEYQDLLTSYFILNEILQEREAEFVIDRKEYDGDNIDDLLIINKDGKFKKQIKYSNADYNHTLSKSDLSTDGSYGLSIDTLYKTWLNNTDRENTDFRICLSWQEPNDELMDLLKEIKNKNTFSNFPTKVFKVKGLELWPQSSKPISSWRRFRTESVNIERDLFLKFCDCLLIEVLMPKLSLDLSKPGELELIVLDQAKNLGIGIFPNSHIQPETFILSLLAIVKRSRSKGTSITISSVFHDLNIKTDFGSIEQTFPVIEAENIKRMSALELFLDQIKASEKILLTGEPGSGKSWFIENLMNHVKSKKINVIRHFCYTDLNDPLQKERIKLNVFYGNLIADILTHYPELKKVKKQKFASNLNELNHLLQNINSATFLIIDGLDHIERIATFREFADISMQDRAIIESLEKINGSSFVKIIVTSQNIPELEHVKSFSNMSLPTWTESDVKQLLKKNGVRNKVLRKGLNLAQFLYAKSSGNPLYVKYLIDEIKEVSFVTIDSLSKLPAYSFNLSEYYFYLLNQLHLREEVPQILSGVSFSLTKQELVEITHIGDYVGESLRILSPVLKINISQSGYSIYHESFRRYLVDHLKSKSISIEQKIFKPIQEWFDSKDFFTYQKSYRYYLQFLSEGGSFDKVLLKLNRTFVTDSVVSGQSWKLIEKNYRLFVKAACHTQDFPSVILLNEIDKIISSCPDYFETIYPIYLQALGKIHGYEYLSSYLLFEGTPTVSNLEGLKACYICDNNGIVAPWAIYIEYFKGKSVEPDEFKYLIRGLLVLKDEKRLNRIADVFVTNPSHQLYDQFVAELNHYGNRDYIDILCAKYKNIATLVNVLKSTETVHTYESTIKMADSILSMDNIYTTELPIVENFFESVRNLIENKELITELIQKFRGKNWFYNWLIYYVKIIQINSKTLNNYNEVKEAFDFLKVNTEPFFGKPRTCDLYSLHSFIYSSFSEGLSLIRNQSEWKETIDTLVRVSNDTTTSLQRSISGPLATDKLFQLLTEFITNDNIDLIIDVFEGQLGDKEQYHLHTDIAEYYLQLASIYAISDNKTKALNYFRKGIEFSLAYTMRKDLTLLDVIEGIEYYAENNIENGLKDLKKARILVDSAVSHTDGKETNHFPVMWFERFLKIDFHKASLYLLNELKDTRYHWWEENSLVNLLCHANTEINPEIEAYISLTLPLEDSERFITYCIKLYDNLEKTNASLANKIKDKIIDAMKPEQNRQRSIELISDFNSKFKDANINVTPKAKSDKTSLEFSPWYKNIADRESFSLMSTDELLLHFEENNIQETDLNSFGYILDGFEELSESAKELTRLIVFKNNKRYYDKLNLDDAFKTGNELECYYWVCRFVADSGGWYQKFVNPDAFIKAYTINAEKAFEFLFELLPEDLQVNFNSSFSSNLIRLLVSLNYDRTTIENCWKNLLDITSYRLPVQSDIEWEEIFDSKMNVEEILLSILLSRFKAETSDRYRFTIMALENLILTEPNKLIKPFQWFLQNKSEFSKVSQIIVLQYIYKHSYSDQGYPSHFEEDIRKGFPSKYFLIDYLVSKLYNLPMSQIYNPKGMIYPTISEGMFDFIYFMNCRFRIFQINGIDVNRCFNKYAATFNLKYKDYFELYGNRVYNKLARHIYGSEYMMEVFNTECYEEFSAWELWEETKPFELGTFIDTNAIAVHANSCRTRPTDLKKPSELEHIDNVHETFEGDWIRLGHAEFELKKIETFKTSSFKSFGGVVFSNVLETGVPYSSYTLFPFQLWENFDLELDLEKKIVFSIIQEDPLEHFKLLWLNPAMVQQLNLTVLRNSEGLYAVNEQGDKILIMRTWTCEHIGSGHNSSLSDEIPTLEGTDLIIREDYFTKLCMFFKPVPKYYTKKIPSEFG